MGSLIWGPKHSISQNPNKIKANEQMKQLDQILNKYADQFSSCSYSEKLDSLCMTNLLTTKSFRTCNRDTKTLSGFILMNAIQKSLRDITVEENFEVMFLLTDGQLLVHSVKAEPNRKTILSSSTRVDMWAGGYGSPLKISLSNGLSYMEIGPIMRNKDIENFAHIKGITFTNEKHPNPKFSDRKDLVSYFQVADFDLKNYFKPDEIDSVMARECP